MKPPHKPSDTTPSEAPVTRDGREIEVQFSASELAPTNDWLRSQHRRFGFELDPIGEIQIRDTYLDTEDWRIYRAGYKLRARASGKHLELTFKSLSTTPPGTVKDRRELTQVIDPATQSPLLPTIGPVAHWLKSLAGNQTPARLFTVETLRTTFVLRRRRQPIAEIALDESLISQAGNRDPVNLRFVEVEGDAVLQDDVQRFLQSMIRECRLEPSRLSKFRAGLQLNELKPIDLPGFNPIEISPEVNVTALALHALRHDFLELLRREPGTRIGEDPEELHDMRVACRRLRAALRLFQAHLPQPLLRCQKSLKWLGSTLGTVRDLDVKTEELQSWRARADPLLHQDFDLILQWMALDRARARDRMLRVLDSRRYRGLQVRLQRSLARYPLRRREPPIPAEAVFPELIRPLHKRLLKTGRLAKKNPLPETMHRLRIACKRLRYALEFASLLDGKRLESYRQQLTKLQNRLGRYNDSVVARATLRRRLQESPDVPPLSTVFLLGILDERLRSRGESCLKRYAKSYRPLGRLPWRSLKAALRDLS